MEDGPRDGAGARTHETRQSDGGGCPPRKVSSTPLMTVRPAGADVKDVGLGVLSQFEGAGSVGT